MPLPVTVDRLKIRVFPDRKAMGAGAASDVAGRISSLQASQPRVRIVFAAAPSQDDVLESLRGAGGIDWARVTALHMDEYVGLEPDHPASFVRYLREHFMDHVKPGEIHFINGSAEARAECTRYGALLKESPIDIVVLGIGENGHIAFNDPPVADFEDPEVIKEVQLDDVCRQQQVNDGCFPAIDDVPRSALSLTIPTLMGASHLYCVVPGPRKAPAVKQTLEGAIATECPATILRRHPECTLYLDRDSASE